MSKINEYQKRQCLVTKSLTLDKCSVGKTQIAVPLMKSIPFILLSQYALVDTTEEESRN